MTRACHPRGFTLIAALFLIVAVLLVAAAMVGTTLSRSRSTVLGLQASQALFAARGALQVARVQALAGGCAAVSTSLLIEQITVDVSCSQDAIDEGGSPLAAYRLDVRAFRGSLADNTFVQRHLMMTVTSG